MRAAIRSGQSYAYPIPYEDDFGIFLTAASPIVSDDGRTVAILGVDYDIGVIQGELRSIDRYALLSIIAAFILACLVGYAALLLIKREQMQRLQAEAHVKGSGSIPCHD